MRLTQILLVNPRYGINADMVCDALEGGGSVHIFDVVDVQQAMSLMTLGQGCAVGEVLDESDAGITVRLVGVERDSE